MTNFIQEMSKLTKMGKALWFATLSFSVGLLLFGVFGLVSQQKDADASAIRDRVEINIPDEEPNTYFPTNSPTLRVTHYPTLSARSSSTGNGVEPTQQPVTSLALPSFHPSMRTDSPSKEQSQLPSQSTTTAFFSTFSPTTSSSALPTQAPSLNTASSSPSRIRSIVPSTTNWDTPFPALDEPYQSVKSSFFNYNTSEGSLHGPRSWSNVIVMNSTENYWHEFGLVDNECSKGPQSPIDVCTQPERNCDEYHEFRAKRGDYKISSEFVEKQILQNKLRALMTRRVGEEPDPPHVDFSGVGYADLDLMNIDIKIPAEHHVCGQMFSGEMQYYFFHPIKQTLIAVSWLLEAKSDNLVNQHMQELIDQFQIVYDANEESCEARTTTNQSDTAAGSSQALGSTRNRRVKKVREPVWDPFHSDIQRTIHFWGYRGSLTEPPCSTEVLWRIMDVAVPISTDQLSQMKNILFTNRDKDSCAFTSTQYKGSVARPISNKSLRYYKCTRSDYVSDDEREMCGDVGCQIPFGKDLDPYFDPIVHVTGPPTESPTSLPSIVQTTAV